MRFEKKSTGVRRCISNTHTHTHTHIYRKFDDEGNQNEVIVFVVVENILINLVVVVVVAFIAGKNICQIERERERYLMHRICAVVS